MSQQESETKKLAEKQLAEERKQHLLKVANKKRFRLAALAVCLLASAGLFFFVQAYFWSFVALAIGLIVSVLLLETIGHLSELELRSWCFLVPWGSTTVNPRTKILSLDFVTVL